MTSVQDYLPEDRCVALARGETLPERTHGSALFADISGFTPLTERLTQQRGPRRGTEEFTRRMNLVYDALIHTVEQHEGCVISFAGDAITCWFDDGASSEPGSAPVRAVSSALRMQAAMRVDPELSLKVAVTTGEAQSAMLGPSSWPDEHARRAYARIVHELEQQLDPAQFAAAWTEGQAMTLDEALDLPPV